MGILKVQLSSRGIFIKIFREVERQDARQSSGGNLESFFSILALTLLAPAFQFDSISPMHAIRSYDACGEDRRWIFLIRRLWDSIHPVCQKEAYTSAHSFLSLWCPWMHLTPAPCERKRSHFRSKSSFIHVFFFVLQFFVVFVQW